MDIGDNKLKKIIWVITSLFIVTALFSQEKIKSMVVISKSENLTDGESLWLPNSVRNKLESNFKTYTNYQMISSNEKLIKDLQRKSETSGFDEDTTIEVGKLTSASHAIVLSIAKINQSYSVTAEVTNLTTGKFIAKKMISGKSQAEQLFSEAGCAADEITIDLCEQLAVPLSNTQKYILKFGNTNFSDTEKLAMFNQEIESYNKQITSYNKEIASLSKTTDLSATAQKAKLESERALAEEKRKVVETNKKRLAEIEKAKEAERMADAARSEEQKKKILDVSKEVNAKVAELRKMKMNRQSSLGMQRLTELKKATLIEIRENMKDEQEAIASKYQKEYEEKINEINNRPWRAAELSKGEPIPNAIYKRNREKESLRIDYEIKIKEEQNSIERVLSPSEKELLSGISVDLSTLEERTFSANTLNGELIVTIGEYDGIKKSWDIEYSVLCDGIELYSDIGEIKYSDLEAIRPSGMTYEDAVDMYISLFRCNEPVLTFEVTYKVKAIRHLVSTYEYNFDAIKVFDTTKVTIKEEQVLDGHSFVCGRKKSGVKRFFSPGYDLRTTREKSVEKLIKENTRKREEAIKENTKKREEAIREKARKREEARRENTRKREERKEMRENIATAIEENKIFYFNAGGAFSANYHISYFEVKNDLEAENINNIIYSVSRGFWLLGGNGELGVGGTYKSFGLGGKIYIGFFKDLSSQFELNFLPIVAQFYLEKHFTSFLSSFGFVMRPQFAIGLGGGGVWGDKVTINRVDYSFEVPAGFIIMASGGLYFDFYLSRNIAIYFAPTMNISALFSFLDNKYKGWSENLFEVRGFFQPSFAVGMRVAPMVRNRYY